MNDLNKHFLCILDDLPIPGSRGFSIKQGEQYIDCFVVRYKGGVSVYLNQCPHTGATLNWQPDQFLSYDNAHIQCSIHGAIFQLSDGLCIHGPCLGQELIKLPSELDKDHIYVKLPEKKHNLP